MAEITYTGCYKYVPFHPAYESAAYYFRVDFFPVTTDNRYN